MILFRILICSCCFLFFYQLNSQNIISDNEIKNPINFVEDEIPNDETEFSSGFELLQNSSDIFSKISSVNLGSFGFRARGLDNRFQDVYFNGISMKNPIDGSLKISNWIGLNNITQIPDEIVLNSSSSKFSFGNLGGLSYFNTFASNYQIGSIVSFSHNNLSSRNRIMFTHSTGKLKNNWFLTFSLSHRWSEKGYFEGTFQKGNSYFIAIEKRINKKHSLNFTTFGTENLSAGNTANTQEVWNLMGKEYNSYWGFQNGKIRNERIRKNFQPIFQLSHLFKINKNSNLYSTFSYQFGENSTSRLNYYNDENPSPTYYQKLPSYQIYKGLSPENAQIFDEPQINWDKFYNLNRNSAQLNLPAAYFMANEIYQDKIMNFSTHFSTKYKKWKSNINLNYTNFKSDNFTEIDDLLGANFALNKDQFGIYGTKNYNEDQTKEKYFLGEKINYNYSLYYQKVFLNPSIEKNYTNFNFKISTFLAFSESFRYGYFRHYLYLNDSKGKSNSFNSFEFGIKNQLNYQIKKHNLLTINVLYSSNAPSLNEIYLDAKINNLFIPEIQNNTNFQTDLSYILNTKKIKIRTTFYFTDIKNQTEVSRYFTEFGSENSEKGYLTEVISNVNKNYLGAEFALEYKLNKYFLTDLLINSGQYVYSNNPNISFYSANENLNQTSQKTYLKNYKLSGTPQKAVSIGIKYNSPKFWWMNFSINYLMENYMKIAAVLRTQNLTTNISTGKPFDGISEDLVKKILEQTKFDDALFMNLSAGKSFKLKNYRLGLSLNLMNLTNNKDFIISGYEQNRKANFKDALQEFEAGINQLFPPKLKYVTGISYFLNLTLKF